MSDSTWETQTNGCFFYNMINGIVLLNDSKGTFLHTEMSSYKKSSGGAGYQQMDVFLLFLISINATLLDI